MSEVVSMGRPCDLARHRLGRRLLLPSGGGVWRSGRALRDYALQALVRVLALLPRSARSPLGSASAHLSHQWHRLARRTSMH